jgi:4,5-epoxidase
MKSEPDVLIAGAGPTGLTLACGLLANGVTARVVDKLTEPVTTSRALGLQPRGIEVVDRLGALGDLPAKAVQVEQIAVHISGKHAANVRVGQRTELVTRPQLTISQALVEGELRRRVLELGGEIVWGREVTGAEQNSDGVTVTFADGEPSRVGWFVGCDGVHSRVRELAGIGFPGVPLAERFLLVDIPGDLPLSRRSIYVWLDSDTLFGAFPLPGENMWRLMVPSVEPGTEGEGMTDDDVLAEVTTKLGEKTECDPAQLGDPVWVTSFRVHRRLAETYRKGRILLAGDAAHVYSPFGAQGMNSGIGDGENLAWKLAMVINGTAEDRLLDSYETERRPVAASAVKSTGAASKLILGNHFVSRFLRDRVIVPLMNKPKLQRKVWENLSQLKVTYRDGPLGRKTRKFFSDKGPVPGDRIPDIDCTRVDGGGNTTLHAELGDHWALVVPERKAGDECAAVVAKRLGDDHVVTLVTDHDADGEIMLVRPDAHLGWRGRADAGALDQWLTAMTRDGSAS